MNNLPPILTFVLSFVAVWCYLLYRSERRKADHWKRKFSSADQRFDAANDLRHAMFNKMYRKAILDARMALVLGPAWSTAKNAAGEVELSREQIEEILKNLETMKCLEFFRAQMRKINDQAQS